MEIKKYRNEFHIPSMEYPSRRAAVWTKEHVSEALAESLLDLCTKFNVCDISDIPVCCLGAVNEDGQIELGEGFTQEDRKFNGRNCSAHKSMLEV